MKSFPWTLAHTAVAAIVTVFFSLTSLPLGVFGYWLTAFIAGAYLPVYTYGPRKLESSMLGHVLVVLVGLFLSATVPALFGPSPFLADLTLFRRFCLIFALGWTFSFLGLGLACGYKFFSRFVFRTRIN